MNMRNLTFICCLLVFGGTLAQGSSEYSIIFKGFPRPVTMTFPDGFHLANSENARQRRERLLDFYRLNPALKGQYDEILLQDWSSGLRYPSIVLGTLGSTVREQGQISTARWQEIRREFLELTPRSIEKIRDNYRPRIEKGSPIVVNITDELIWLEEQSDPNEVVIVAHFHSEIDGELVSSFSARKFVYHKGYLVFVNVYVDSSSPGALSDIKFYLDALKIVSI